MVFPGYTQKGKRAIMPKGLKGRSSQGREGYLTYGPFENPGMPDIGAVEMFRNNAEDKLQEAEGYFKRKVEDIEWENDLKPIRHNTRTAIRHTDSDGPLEVRGYFDSSIYKSEIEKVGKEIKREGIRFVKKAMYEAQTETQIYIMQMRRAFKSGYFSQTAHRDDVYYKVAQSLDFKVRYQDETKNQFIQVYGGSYAQGAVENEPTGVLGSRGGNIAIMTEEGTDAFTQDEMPLAGTARIQEKLKHR